MEFRYRAIDTDRPPPVTDTTQTQSPKPNLSFLTERSMPGSCEVNVQEAIQREIEKEQIRQEIIIAEATRKREIIAEVLQEMAIEREMAKRSIVDTGMSFEEKLTMWINQKKLPNQIQNNNLLRQNCIDPLMNSSAYNSLVTSLPMMQLPQLQNMPESTVTSNKEKLIELNRADPIGEKRKPDEKLIVLDRADPIGEIRKAEEKLIVLDRADSVGEKRKAEDTQTGLNENLQVKKQKTKESALEAKTMSLESGEIVSSKLPCLGKLGSGKPVKSKLRRSFKFWCEICKVGAFTQTVMRNHELGKKHLTAVTQQNEALEVEAASTSLALASGTAQQSEAITVSQDVNPQGQEVDEMFGKKIDGENKKNVMGWCKMCNVYTNSEQMMESHRLGKKHKRQQNKAQTGWTFRY